MTTRDATVIVYPEKDGLPLPDGDFQAPLYVRIGSTLKIHFAGIPGIRLNGNAFIYYAEGDQRHSTREFCPLEIRYHKSALPGNGRSTAAGDSP